MEKAGAGYYNATFVVDKLCIYKVYINAKKKLYFINYYEAPYVQRKTIKINAR